MNNIVSLRYFVPSIFSALNLIFGVGMLYYGLSNNSKAVVFCLIGSILSDFFDGFLARKLNATSSFGKLLDTFSDAISFGLATSFFIYFQMISLGQYPAFTLAIFYFSSCLWRLFKYLKLNNSKNFSGLPSPIGSLVVVTGSIIFRDTYPLLILNIVYITLLLNIKAEYIHIKNIKNTNTIMGLLATIFLIFSIIYIFNKSISNLFYTYIWCIMLIYTLSPIIRIIKQND